MKPKRRAFGKTRAAIAVARAAVMVPRWRYASTKWRKKRAYEQAFYRRIASGFVAKVELRGTPVARPGTLYVSNHISWLDIPMIASVIDTDFIAKDDIEHWPLIGGLSRRTGTLFVSRTARHQAQRHLDDMIAALQSGVSLMLFAEGNTSDGAGVLPFLSSLFAAAPYAAAVQPVFVGYRHAGGAWLSDAEMAAIGWTGDDELVPNAAGVAGMKIEGVVTLLDPVPASASTNRRSITAYCHTAISEGYAALRAEGRPA